MTSYNLNPKQRKEEQRKLRLKKNNQPDRDKAETES